MFGSITLEPPLVFLPRTGTWRRTRTPTAVKGNAHSRFHTTACRLRNYRTLSASGRFSTSDSPPRLPLNLYCKSAAPCQGVATLPLCIFSIAGAPVFVNVLINKNQLLCSVKTPNFRRPHANAPCMRGIGDRPRSGAQPENRRAHPTVHSGGSFMSAVARRGALPAEDPVVQILLHGAFTSRFNGIRPLYAGRSEKMHEQGS